MPNLPASGGFAAPENAPKETSQPLSAELIAQQQASARRNEKVLPPFNPKPLGQPRGLVAKATRAVEEFFGASADAVQTPPDAPVAAAGPVAGPLDAPSEDPPPLPPPEPWQKAASDSDTPSRGIPTASADPGKAITGGFGGLGPAQYFPLDGSEVGAVILTKLDELVPLVQNDLRLSMAATYPRVRVTVEVRVEGFGDMASDFRIPARVWEHGKTPVEVAREYAHEVCFVMQAEHVEMLPDGTSVTPPNKVRIEMGLQVPQMQRIETPGGGVIVDRV